MPSLLNHTSQKAIKMLLIGDSGSGKTGALASLVELGYELAILDYDNGLDILVNVLKAKPNANELLGRVYFETVTEKMRTVAGKVVPVNAVPQAWSKGMNILTNWAPPHASDSLGPIDTWGPNRILVIDSLTFVSNSAYMFVDKVSGLKDGRAVYGEAQSMVESMLQLLYSESVKCNVIVNSHITFVELESGLTKGYPSGVGRALSPKIPRYFNTILEAKTKGSGASAKHVILTQPDGLIELKNSATPGSLPGELPLETGLADFFRRVTTVPTKGA